MESKERRQNCSRNGVSFASPERLQSVLRDCTGDPAVSSSLQTDGAAKSSLEGKRILLVDDDPDIIQSIEAAFEPTGAILETAMNGNKAVELCEANTPDLMILDMMLPGRSGFLVLEKVKARKPKGAKPLVIMITGNPGSRHKMYAESLGVSAYFNKPVKMEKLVTTAEQLLSPPAETPPV
jgi:two-component system OmpR family response regulator